MKAGRARLYGALSLVGLVVLFSKGDQLDGRLLFGGLVVALVLAVLRAPELAIVGFVVLGGAVGGPMILVAAPAVLLLAHRSMARRRPAHRRNVDARRALLAAGLVAVATLPFAAMAYGPRRPQGRGGAAAGAAGGTGVSAKPLQGLGDLVSKLLGRGAGGAHAAAGGSGASGGSVPPPPHDPTRWWPWALLAVAVVLLALGAWLLVRRRRRRGDVTAAWSLARLEAVGRRVGVRRRPDQGVLAYAQDLARRTGDPRLGAAGAAVSGDVYASPSTSPPAVAASLGDLEAHPPARPPRHPWQACARWARAHRPSRRAVALAAVVVLVSVWAVPKLSSLSDRGTAFAAAGFDPHDPPAWSALWAAPAEQVQRWASCSTSDEEVVARVGVDAVDTDLAAVATVTTDPTAPAHDPGLRSRMVYDGEHLQVDGGPGWFTLGQQPVGSWRAFADMAAVRRTFALVDPVESTGTDAEGRTFQRYESLPVRRGGAPAPGSIAGAAVTDGPWVLDVWLDATGAPERVRQLRAADGGWAEWRRLPASTGVAAPPVCTTPEGAPAPGWVGPVAWEPTRTVPLHVAFDPAGNPYEPVDVGGAAWHHVLDVVATAPRWQLTTPDAIGVDAADAWATPIDLPVPPGTSARIDRFGGRGEDVAAYRIRLGDGPAVARWQDGGGLELDDVAPALVLHPLQGVGADDVWEAAQDAVGDDGVARAALLDVDGDGVDDVALLGGYGGDATARLGYDGRGVLREVVLDMGWVPWRQLGLPGGAPVDVLAREAQLRACVAGTRAVGLDGSCARGG